MSDFFDHSDLISDEERANTKAISDMVRAQKDEHVKTVTASIPIIRQQQDTDED